MRETDILASQLEAAIRAGNVAQLAVSAAMIERFVFDNASFPEDLFSKVLSVIRGADFQKLPDSVPAIKLFEYNLELLTGEQRQQLAVSLTEVIPKLVDATAGFLSVELIAEIWYDRRSFDAIFHLMQGACEKTLALAVHGLDWLAKKTNETDVRRLCLDELRRLSKNNWPLVKAEAIAALNRRTRPG